MSKTVLSSRTHDDWTACSKVFLPGFEYDFRYQCLQANHNAAKAARKDASRYLKYALGEQTRSNGGFDAAVDDQTNRGDQTNSSSGSSSADRVSSSSRSSQSTPGRNLQETGGPLIVGGGTATAGRRGEPPGADAAGAAFPPFGVVEEAKPSSSFFVARANIKGRQVCFEMIVQDTAKHGLPVLPVESHFFANERGRRSGGEKSSLENSSKLSRGSSVVQEDVIEPGDERDSTSTKQLVLTHCSLAVTAKVVTKQTSYPDSAYRISSNYVAGGLEYDMIMVGSEGGEEVNFFGSVWVFVFGGMIGRCSFRGLPEGAHDPPLGALWFPSPTI